MEIASQRTDAPEVYHLASGLVVAAAILGDRVWLDYGPGRLFPNLWMVLVGPSSLFHRSTAIRIAQTELGRVRHSCILPDEYSREKLERNMEGAHGGVMFWSELANVLSALERQDGYLSGVKALITQWYDGDPYHRETLNYQVHMDATPLNILAGTTTAWWERVMRDSDLAGGFLPRWCVVYAQGKSRSEPFPQMPAPQALDELSRHLSEMMSLEGGASLTPQARAQYVEWYKACEQRVVEHGDFGAQAIWSRLAVVCLKLAMLYQATSDMTLTVGTKALDRAQAFTSWLMESSRVVLGRLASDQTGRDYRAVLDALTARPDGMSRSELLRGVRMGARRLQAALDTGFQSEEVVAERVKRVAGGGPAAQVYKLGRPS
jgi:hypothetical protein